MTRIITALFFAWFGIAQRDSYDELLKHWAYDQNAALSVKEAGVQDRGGIKIHDISFKAPSGNRAASIGPNGSTVTAYLVVPPGDGPFAAVVYGHWCMPGSAQLNRTEFLEEAVVLARSGVVALLPDHVIARPGFNRNQIPLNLQQVDVLVQQIVNTRRGIDLLVARKDVDPKRVAYVGHSCNGEVGGFLSGIEKPRLNAVVVMAGPLSDEVNLKTKTYQDYRQKVGPEKFDTFAATYAWLDPGKYTRHSEGVAKLLQFATGEDMLNPDVARQYLPYVSDPKTLQIYEAPHALNADATRDRLAFLAQQLEVKQPDAKSVATIPPLVQPK